MWPMGIWSTSPLARRLVKGLFDGLTAEMHLLADVLEAGVAHERAGKQAGLGEDLKAVADAEDKPAGVGELFDRLHDGSKAGDGAGAEIVAIGEAAGDEHRIDSLQIGGVVPEKGDGLTARLRRSRFTCRDRSWSREKPEPRISWF